MNCKKNISIFILLILITTGFFLLRQTRLEPFSRNIPPKSNNYNKLPLYFIQNRGQWNPDILFGARGKNYGVNIRPQKIELNLQKNGAGENLAINLLNANPLAKIEKKNKLSGIINFYYGNNPNDWFLNIPTHSRLKMNRVYPGIDLVFYGMENELEYDFVIEPEADPSLIQLQITGAHHLETDSKGNLICHMKQGQIIQKKPVIYQVIEGRRIEIDGKYQLSGNRLAFNPGNYNSQLPLVIDPVISYSSYIGGNGEDQINSVAVDSQGYIYLTGSTTSTDFPLESASQASLSGNSDVFITRLAPDGSELVYSTYMGGLMKDEGRDLAVNGNGDAFVTGITNSADFPVNEPYQAAKAGNQDCFLAKINSQGQLVFSTYLGGTLSDTASRVVLDSSGKIYLSGYTRSVNFPVENPLQAANNGGDDAFITCLDNSGSEIIFSSYLGGSENDRAYGLAIGPLDAVYLCGKTNSNDFPTQNPYQNRLQGSSDGFLAKIDSALELEYSTYLGGENDEAITDMVLDGTYPVVTGYTDSSDFPTANPWQNELQGDTDAFIARFDSNGNSLNFSTYIGGRGTDEANSLVMDENGTFYVGGVTNSSTFPVQNALDETLSGPTDGFVSQLDSTGSNLLFSTYLGGSSTDQILGLGVLNSNIYLAGSTNSNNFPAENGLQATLQGNTDGFVTRISSGNFSLTPTQQSGSGNAGGKVYYTLQLTNNSSQAQRFTITLGDHDWDMFLATEDYVRKNARQIETGVEPGHLVKITVGVLIPVYAGQGDSEQVTITVVSTTDPNQTATSKLTTNVTNIGGLELSPENYQSFGEPGSAVEYILTLKNTGSISDSYTVSISGNLWTVTHPERVGPVAAGATEEFKVTVYIPADAWYDDEYYDDWWEDNWWWYDDWYYYDSYMADKTAGSTRYSGSRDGALVTVTSFLNPSKSKSSILMTTAGDVEPGASSCFIATAAFGSYQETHVQVLRQFRDNYLITNKPGKWFVRTYYTHSPALAEKIASNPMAKRITRGLLLPLYGFGYMSVNHPLWLVILLIGSGILICFAVKKMKPLTIKIRRNKEIKE